MNELVQWFGQQLDEDERETKGAAEELGPDWYYDAGAVRSRSHYGSVALGSQDFLERERGEYIARHDPARALREIDAKRELLRQYEHLKHDVMPDDMSGVFAMEAVIRAHAAAYADRPGYREEWKP